MASVPRRLWDMASERIASSETTPPALRITWASPGSSPRSSAGSSLESMQASTASLRAGALGRSPLSKVRRRQPRSSGDRLNGNVEELDRRTALRSAGIHRIERLVAATHGLLALEQRHAEPLAGLAIDEHQHLRALEPLRCLLGLDRRTDHLDRLVDVGRIALERRYARVHRLPLVSHQDGFSLRRSALWAHATVDRASARRPPAR